MKKKKLFCGLLAALALVNALSMPVRAETEPSEPTEPGTSEFQNAPTEPAAPSDHLTGDISVTGGSNSINAAQSLMSLIDLQVNAKAALLYEVDTKTMVYGYNVDEKLYPASLTKVMTCLVAVEHCDLSEMITVPQEVMDRVDPSGSGMDLVTGEKLTMEELLYGLMVESANDAAMVIATHLCGSEEAFVELMNQKARELGCEQTHFMNVHGLHHEEHYTTARDMARILVAALENETFYRFFTTSFIRIAPTNKSEERKMSTTNYMMSRSVTEMYYDTRVLGGKTGFTTPAGRCLVTLSESGGMRFVSVVMGAQLVYAEDGYSAVSYGNFEETKKLIDKGFANFEPVQILSPNQILGQFQVENGTSSVQGVVQTTIDTLIPVGCDFSSIRYEYILDDGALVAPIEKGTPLGIVRVWYQTKCLAQAELYAASYVAKDVPETVSGGNVDPAAPVTQDPGLWHMVLLAILVLLALLVLLLLAGYIRGAMVRAKRAKRRKERTRSR